MQNRLLLLSVLVLASTVVALVAGILKGVSGGQVSEEIQSGSVAFAASMTLGVLLVTWLGRDSRD